MGDSFLYHQYCAYIILILLHQQGKIIFPMLISQYIQQVVKCLPLEGYLDWLENWMAIGRQDWSQIPPSQ